MGKNSGLFGYQWFEFISPLDLPVFKPAEFGEISNRSAKGDYYRAIEDGFRQFAMQEIFYEMANVGRNPFLFLLEMELWMENLRKVLPKTTIGDTMVYVKGLYEDDPEKSGGWKI